MFHLFPSALTSQQAITYPMQIKASFILLADLLGYVLPLTQIRFDLLSSP
jgi:hypothetical protein